MDNLEISVTLSGEELKSLQQLAGSMDKTKLRATARALLKTTIKNMGKAMESCLEGRIGDIDLQGNDEPKE